MFSETQAGVRTLILNDLAQEVSPHSKEVLPQEVRIILPLTGTYTSTTNSAEDLLWFKTGYYLSFRNQKHEN